MVNYCLIGCELYVQIFKRGCLAERDTMAMTEKNMTSSTMTDAKRSTRAEWNYHPDLPIDNNPLFSWPVRWKEAAMYYHDGWLTLSESSLFIVMATLTYLWLSPSLEQTTTPDWIWISGIWLRNLIITFLVAGGLHYYFYHHKGQKTELKYVAPFLSRGERFLFGNQLYDNMFYTLVSGVAIWSAYEAFLFWAMGSGYVSLVTFRDAPIWTIAALPLISIWISFHFYFVHRLLHLKPLYEKFHALHHRNVNVGPFSGISMHPFEHLLYFSSTLIHLLVPTHLMHVIFHFFMLALSAIFGHTGFDALLVRNARRLAIGHFHHQLHHRYFECNYGSVDMPWDKWFGSFHDGTPEARARLKDKLGRRV